MSASMQLLCAEISDGGGLHEAAHELLRALPAGAHPEAQKVEQEPVAWMLVNAGGSEVITRDHPGEWPNATVRPLYTHPAPASDELLEALEWFCDRVDRGEARSKATYTRFKTLIAKHKGPQS